MSMNKEELRQLIIAKLGDDHRVLLQAAKAAHAAATHEENIPDDKYETLALEASYIAQGQANRAQEIGAALGNYRKLQLLVFDEETPIRLTALVELEADNRSTKLIFLGPAAGGLQIEHHSRTISVVTPESPLGQALIGRCVGDQIRLSQRTDTGYEIIRSW
jgi:transcription elongation GreA/GreB family factor